MNDIMLVSVKLGCDRKDTFRTSPKQVQSTTQFHEHTDQIAVLLTYAAPVVMVSLAWHSLQPGG